MKEALARMWRKFNGFRPINQKPPEARRGCNVWLRFSDGRIERGFSSPTWDLEWHTDDHMVTFTHWNKDAWPVEWRYRYSDPIEQTMACWTMTTTIVFVVWNIVSISAVLLILSSCTTNLEDGESAQCQPCSSDLSCRPGLACDHETWLCKTPGMFAQDRGCSAECDVPEVTTSTGTLSLCEFAGQCNVVNGKCRATDEADCVVSWGCAFQGACRLVDGQCAP